MNKTRLAWHFVGNTLRGGRPVPKDGEWLTHVGRLLMCKAGLHASMNPLDALTYAPNGILCRVRLGGQIIEDADKMVARRRRIVWRIDAKPVLKAFARWCALQVVAVWNAPDVVVRYLRTGDESIMDAARAAAWAAAWDAAWTAAGAAARAAAYARAAAWTAARDAQNKQLYKMVMEARKGKTSWVFEEQANA